MMTRITANTDEIVVNRELIDYNYDLININKGLIDRNHNLILENRCGISNNAAMSALPLTGLGKFNVAVGAGSFGGCNAGAVGGMLNIDKINLRLTGAFNDITGPTIAGGVGFSWP